MARTFILEASLLGQFWVDDAYAATYVVNRLSTPVLDNKSPFERLFQKPPNYPFLRVLGCECYLTLLTRSHKLEHCSSRCAFLGYASNYKGY